MQLLSLLHTLFSDEQIDKDRSGHRARAIAYDESSRDRAYDIAYLQWTPYATDASAIYVLIHPLQTRIHITLNQQYAAPGHVYSVLEWLWHLIHFETETTFELYCRTSSVWDDSTVNAICLLPNVHSSDFFVANMVMKLLLDQGVDKWLEEKDGSLLQRGIAKVLESPELQELAQMQANLPTVFPFSGQSIQNLCSMLKDVSLNLQFFTEQHVSGFRTYTALLNQLQDIFESGSTNSVVVCIDSSDNSLAAYSKGGWTLRWYSYTGKITLPSSGSQQGLDFLKSNPERPLSLATRKIKLPNYVTLLSRTHSPHQCVLILGEYHKKDALNEPESKEDVHNFLVHLVDSFPDVMFDLWTEHVMECTTVPHLMEISSRGIYLLYKTFYQKKDRPNIMAHNADPRMLVNTRALVYYFVHGWLESSKNMAKELIEEEENTLIIEQACEEKLNAMDDNFCPGLREALAATLQKHLRVMQTPKHRAETKEMVTYIRDFLNANKTWPLPKDVVSRFVEYILSFINFVDVYTLAGMMAHSRKNNIMYAGIWHAKKCRDMLVRTGQYRVVEEYQAEDLHAGFVQALSWDKIESVLVR